MRIVVADQDTTLLEVLRRFIWNQGHEIELAADGIECLTAVREFHPEVVVVGADLLWGGAEGVLDVMRSDPELLNTPAIVIGDSRKDCDSLSHSTRTSFLRKPFRIGALLHAIEMARVSRQSFPKRSPIC